MGPGGSLRKDLGIPETAVLALTVGSLIPRKRIDFIFKAMRLASLGERCHLIVVGEGAELGNLQDLARQERMEPIIHFLGMRNDVGAVMHEADCLLHSALAEASPYVVLEAMAAGLPVIATASGAIPEQVVAGVTGFVLARNDMQGFAGALRSLVADVDLRASMRASAVNRWRTAYHENDCVASYVQLYRDVTD